MLGTTNVSFVAQTAEWVPAHLYATLRAAYQHRGLGFVRILQRCPMYTLSIYERAVKDPSLIELLVHDDGVDGARARRDLSRPARARSVATSTPRARWPKTASASGSASSSATKRARATTTSAGRTKVSATERIALLDQELDKYAV